MTYSLKKSQRSFFWETGLSFEDVEGRLASGQITKDWLICPLGDANRAISVSQFITQPAIFATLPTSPFVEQDSPEKNHSSEGVPRPPSGLDAEEAQNKAIVAGTSREMDDLLTTTAALVVALAFLIAGIIFFAPKIGNLAVHVIAAAHISGALLVLGGLHFLRWAYRNHGPIRMTVLEEIALSLGVSPKDVFKVDKSKVNLLLAAKYSSELFSNRVADLFGWLVRAWGGIGMIAQVGFLIAGLVGWLAEGPENAVFVWGAVAAAAFFWITTFVFSAICRLLLGRNPGEARRVRKYLAEQLKANERELASTP